MGLLGCRGAQGSLHHAQSVPYAAAYLSLCYLAQRVTLLNDLCHLRV